MKLSPFCYKLAAAFMFASAISVFTQDAKSGIGSLGWLTGCWEQTGKGSSGMEQWMKPAGQSMLGMSRTIKNGRTSGYEFLRIIEDGKDLFYISRPSQNKEETSFKLVKSGSREVIFENPAHDFPQRILYRRDKNNLAARIEGTLNGKLRGIDFPMVRSRCD